MAPPSAATPGTAVAAIVLALLAGLPVPAAAQQDAYVGPHANRQYERYEPFEVYDPASGLLRLTFTDLVLPGNGGWNLAFQRTFNTLTATWTFGLAGIPLKVAPYGPNDPPPLATVNGLVYAQVGVGSGTAMTAQFWRYHLNDRTLGLPDGTRAWYDASHRLSQVTDAAGRVLLTAVWEPQQLTLTQHVGNNQDRVVVLTGGQWLYQLLGGGNFLPSSMTYQGRTWSYAPNSTSTATASHVTPPVGPAWHFEWERGHPTCSACPQWLRVTLPTGGTIHYTFEYRNEFDVPRNTLRFRRTFDLQEQLIGEWEYQYAFQPSSSTTTVASPSGATTTYGYQRVTDHTIPFGPQTVLVSRTVSDGAVTLEQEQIDHELVPFPDWGGTAVLPAPKTRTLTRDGVTHTTTYSYSASNYGDFHHPNQIVETTNGVSRTTTLAYAHAYAGPTVWPYFVGLPTLREVSVGGDTSTMSWTYDMNTRFLTSETVNGLTTAFTPDTLGNVQRVTRPNGKTTDFAYSWGQVSQIQTPEPGYAITSGINPDGTLQWETQAGRTTSFEWDAIGRLTEVQGPGGTTKTVITYENGSPRVVTTSRGASSLTTTLDGFGRPVATVDSQGVRTRTAYDALGRPTYQSYPYQIGVGDGDVGTSLSFDSLHRVTRETHPDGSFRDYLYAGNTVTVRDEEHTAQTPRQTVYTYQAFGSPDDARLVQLQDALTNIWSYSYTAAGEITQLSGPNGVTRTWNYTGPNKLLDSETHPEWGSGTGPGTVTYSYVDGVLTQRTDANGTVFTYARDANDRVKQVNAGGRITTLTYETGSDHVATMSVDGVTTTWGLDAAGRLETRTDVVDGKTFETNYAYYANDALFEITYPSGRRVRYDYDLELRITRVYNEADTTYASDFTYHPSGALTSYKAGNELVSTFAYDSKRYWVEMMQVGGGSLFHLDYDHFKNGNVKSIADARAGKNQLFGYDVLDRLTSVTTGAGYPSASLAWDAYGNRQAANLTYYANNPFRLKSIGGFGDLLYNNTGALTGHSGGAFQYDYTPDSRLASVSAGGVTTQFAYAADAWRIKRVVAGQPTVYSIRGPNGELLTDWSNATPIASARDYVYAGGRLLAAVVTAVPPK